LKLAVESGEQDLEFIMKMPIPTDEGYDAPRQAKITSHINDFQGVKARPSCSSFEPVSLKISENPFVFLIQVF